VRKSLLAAFRNYYRANLLEIAELDDLRGALIAEAPIEQRRSVARAFNRWLASRRGDEDIAKPDPELASSLGLLPNQTSNAAVIAIRSMLLRESENSSANR